MAEEGIPTYRLLQPELMNRDELVDVLQRYNLKCDLKRTENSELICIYRRLALPLPQRIYGSTWRERILAKKQNRRKISLGDIKKNAVVSTESSAPSSVNRPAQRDRLKPPVDPSGTKEKKIIKINPSKKGKDNVVANKSSKKNGEPPKSDSSDEKATQSKHKRIRIDFSDSAERSTPIPKVVGIKRRSSSSDEKGSTQTASKHRRIVI